MKEEISRKIRVDLQNDDLLPIIIYHYVSVCDFSIFLIDYLPAGTVPGNTIGYSKPLHSEPCRWSRSPGCQLSLQTGKDFGSLRPVLVKNDGIVPTQKSV